MVNLTKFLDMKEFTLCKILVSFNKMLSYNCNNFALVAVLHKHAALHGKTLQEYVYMHAAADGIHQQTLETFHTPVHSCAIGVVKQTS